jgi:hypothetical protein
MEYGGISRAGRLAAPERPYYPFPMTQTREYKVVLYREGMLGSLFLGSSKVDPERFSEFLNRNAAQGWRVVTMEKESRRMMLFFEREAFLVVMERDKL